MNVYMHDSKWMGVVWTCAYVAMSCIDQRGMFGFSGYIHTCICPAYIDST